MTEIEQTAAKVFPPFDPSLVPNQLLWLGVILAVFYFILAKNVLPQIAAAIERRQDRLAFNRSEAKRLSEESSQVIAEFEAERGKAALIAKTVIAKQRQQLTDKNLSSMSELNAQITQMLRDGGDKIRKGRVDALDKVDAIADSVAIEIARGITGFDITEAEVASARKAME